MNLNKRKILILGGSGFIGSNLVKSLAEEGSLVTVISRDPRAVDKNLYSLDNVQIIQGSLDQTDFVKLIEDIDCKIIIHLVSNLIPSSNQYDYGIEESRVINPTHKIIELCSKKNIKFIYFSSGGMLYGKDATDINESQQLLPFNYYGKSKYRIEQKIKEYSSLRDLDSIILRPSNIYGRLHNLNKDQGFIERLIDNITKEKKMVIWGSGKQMRDFLYVEDLVLIIIELIKADFKQSSVNVANGSSHSLLEIIKICENILNKKATIEFKDKRGIDSENIGFDISLLKETISFLPDDIEKGLKKYIKRLAVNE